MNYKKVVSLLLFFMLYIPAVYSQPTFNCILKNDAFVSGSMYEVDIYILSTSGASIELAAIAEGFTINDAALNGGVVTASWVPGTNELSNTSQTPTLFNNSAISGNFRISKIAGKIPPGPGNGSIISNVAPGTRIGRLRLTNSVQFSSTQLSLAWLMNLPYPTSLNAYINGINTDITQYGTFTSELLNQLLPVKTEIALPKEFSISQNYPNPFNPTTKIEYKVPAEAHVSLEIYNISGQKVKEVVNQIQEAGVYSVNFGSASMKLTSGVYIYRLNASEIESGKRFSSIKKMMLLK